MRPRFQADADLNHKIVLALKRREPAVDILDAHQGGVIEIADPMVLEIAAKSDRILLTHDRKTLPSDFVRFREIRPSPGLIVVTQALSIGAAIEDLLLIWAATEAEEWRNKIGFVPL